VCTHFLPAQLAAGRAGAPPFAAVVTDYTLHRYWAQPRVGHYFVAAPDLARDLHRRLPSARIVATGIPISASFGSGMTRAAARAALGLSGTRRTALVMGGGLGMGVEESVRAALDSGVAELQVLAICGRNRSARDRLISAGVPDERLRVFGYVDDVATLITAADVVITKPGGLTCSEALAVGRPLVLTRAIPGHEEGNVNYLTSCGAAIAAPATGDIASALRSLLLDTSALARYTWSARAIGTPTAARSIAADLTRRFVRKAAA
jgi:processive 1,2-diacylglycerol beta-glucosyltransferase